MIISWNDSPSYAGCVEMTLSFDLCLLRGREGGREGGKEGGVGERRGREGGGREGRKGGG